MYVIPELDYSQDFVKENMQAYIYDKNEKKDSSLFIHSFMQCLRTHHVPDTVLGLGLGISTDQSLHPSEFYILKQRRIEKHM